MGRGVGEQTSKTLIGKRDKNEAELAEKIADSKRFIALWMSRSRSNDKSGADLEEIMQLRAAALRALTYSPTDQREIIRIARETAEIIAHYENMDKLNKAQSGILAEARMLNNDARELFILCHRGFVERMISKHVQRFDSESEETARDILHQACDIGLLRTIDRFNFSEPSNPLTYATRVMQDEIKREAEAGRLVRLKSKANTLGDKIEQLAREIEFSGRQVTVAELAEKLGEDPSRVAEILPYARRHTVRLDAPISTDDQESTLGTIIEDQSDSVETITVTGDTREKLIDALETLPPFERKVVEVAYGLSGESGIDQKDLFDGVYRDKSGKGYSSRDSIINDRKKRGEAIKKVGQRELTEQFKSGELVFEPGNPEAHALALAAKGNDISEGKWGRYITKETGVPPTPGVIQDALRNGLDTLAKHESLEEMRPTYRGNNVLENSESAREKARKILVIKGVMSEQEAGKLVEVRSANGQKSKLRVAAEKHGIIDPDTGNWTSLDPEADAKGEAANKKAEKEAGSKKKAKAE